MKCELPTDLHTGNEVAKKLWTEESLPLSRKIFPGSLLLESCLKKSSTFWKMFVQKNLWRESVAQRSKMFLLVGSCVTWRSTPPCPPCPAWPRLPLQQGSGHLPPGQALFDTLLHPSSWHNSMIIFIVIIKQPITSSVSGSLHPDPASPCNNSITITMAITQSTQNDAKYHENVMQWKGTPREKKRKEFAKLKLKPGLCWWAACLQDQPWCLACRSPHLTHRTRTWVQDLVKFHSSLMICTEQINRCWGPLIFNTVNKQSAKLPGAARFLNIQNI